MATTASGTAQSFTASAETVERICRAQAFLPRIRDLRLMLDVLEKQPISTPGIADRVLEVSDELRLAEAELVETLSDGAR